MKRRVLVLSGGIGGAKLVLGFKHLLAPGELTVVVNTGDDFEHLGLTICPDIDTTLYTLAGLDNRALGWGRQDESWNVMDALARYDGPTWFRLGDRDLALHLVRTQRLALGERLTTIIASIALLQGINATVLPMCDQPVRTIIETADGELSFQHYFVRDQCRPVIRAIRYDGAQAAIVTPEIEAAFRAPELAAVILAPSNPYLSIGPLLALPGLRRLLATTPVPVVAISPIIGGAAVKGPTAKIMAELGVDCSAANVATHYRGLIDGYILDQRDAALAAGIDLPTFVTHTLMQSLDDRIRLAREALTFATSLGTLARGRRA
jgi:LPPG:FO 2-phospho-L-lactate transferase